MAGAATRPALPAADRALAARALAWLAQREHSRAELRRKLLTHALAPEKVGAGGRPGAVPVSAGTPCESQPPDKTAVLVHIDVVLDWLEARDHLSQQRFVESRVQVRSQRFGNLRIRQELAQHGITLPDDANAALRETEIDRARAVWERKFARRPGKLPSADKQARFLAGRGFSGDVIRRVVQPVSASQGSNVSAERA